MEDGRRKMEKGVGNLEFGMQNSECRIEEKEMAERMLRGEGRGVTGG
jgi:hypothetical protein